MKKHGLYFFAILLFNAVVILSGYYGWKFQFIFNCLACIVIASLLHTEKLTLKLLTLMSPLAYFIVWVQVKNLNPLPIVFIPPLFLIILLFLSVRTQTRIIITGAFLILSVLGYFGMETWFEYAMNRHQKKLIGKTFPQIELVHENGMPFTDLFTDTASLFVLDCWSSNCGVCFKKLPQFEQLQQDDKYKNVRFYTLNLPIKRDSFPNLSHQLARFYNLSNNLYARNLFSKDSLNCDGVPLYVLVQNQRILYNGFISLESSNASPDLRDKIDEQLQ